MDTCYSTTFSEKHKKYSHLTLAERGAIQALHQLGYSIRAIALETGCSKSTVAYELKQGTREKNGIQGRNPKYNASYGQAVHEQNRANCHRILQMDHCLPFLTWMYEQMKKEKWSIDVCVGYARVNHLFPYDEIPCTKTVYNWTRKGLLKISLIDLPEALKRKNTGSQKAKRNQRNLGTSIEERPDIVDQKTEFGHWELDTVQGSKSASEPVIFTLLEKTSRYYLALKVPGKTASAIQSMMEQLHSEFGEQFSTVFKTITADNGSEFAELSSVENWGTRVYFAHPYAASERGQNERHNRILRRFVPKGKSIRSYSASKVINIMFTLNNTPKKILGYHTPDELFEAHMDRIYAIH